MFGPFSVTSSGYGGEAGIRQWRRHFESNRDY